MARARVINPSVPARATFKLNHPEARLHSWIRTSPNSGTDTTIVAANFSSSLSTLVLSDDNSAPASGNVKMRFVNAAPDLGPADIYILPPSTDINTVSPNISSLRFGSASEYQNMAAADFEIVFTVAGQKIPQIDSGSLSLSAGQVRTFVSLNSSAGGFTETVLDHLD